METLDQDHRDSPGRALAMQRWHGSTAAERRAATAPARAARLARRKAERPTEQTTGVPA